MRHSLLLLLLLFHGHAIADWARIDNGRQANVEKYVDLDTIKQTGPMAIMRQVWEVSNYLFPDKTDVLSVKILMEYDCQNTQSRMIKEFWYSKLWAKGSDITPAEINQTT